MIDLLAVASPGKNPSAEIVEQAKAQVATALLNLRALLDAYDAQPGLNMISGTFDGTISTLPLVQNPLMGAYFGPFNLAMGKIYRELSGLLCQAERGKIELSESQFRILLVDLIQLLEGGKQG